MAIRDEVEKDRMYDKRGRLLLPLLAIIVLSLIAWVIWLLFRDAGNFYNNQSQNQGEFTESINAGSFYRSLPSHRETIPEYPLNVVILVNGRATASSKIEIKNNGGDYGSGNTIVESDGKVLRRDVLSSTPDGIYTVNYSICGTDAQCQNGQFQFKINKNGADYQNLNERDAVTVNIDSNGFNPANIVVSEDTRITWRNNTNQNYTIYPGNEDLGKYFPGLNSGTVAPGRSFSLTASETGYISYYAKEGKIIKGNFIIE